MPGAGPALLPRPARERIHPPAESRTRCSDSGTRGPRRPSKAAAPPSAQRSLATAGIRERAGCRTPAMPGLPFPVRRTAVRRIAALLAGCLASAVLVLGPGATPAWGHDALTGTAPVQEATVDTSPPQVRLEFTQPPQPLGGQVLVSGPDGASASRGAVEVDGTSVIQPLVRDLPSGSYTVEWRVTSADGHPLSGSFSFAVAGLAAAGPSAPDAAPAGSAHAVPDAGPAAPAPRSLSSPVIGTAVAAILAAGGLLVVRRRRTRP